MGVDTRAIIRKGTTLKEIKDVLETHYSEVMIHSTSDSKYFRLIFDDGDDDTRMLGVFLDDAAKIDYNINGQLLSLGYRGKSVEIMKTLLDVFGGYLDENDCDDKDFYPVNIEEFKKGRDFSPTDLLTNEIIQKLGYENLNTVLGLFETYKKSLSDIRDSLNDEIIKINTTLLKDDIGVLDKDDTWQTKSFSRGKALGLIIAKDRLNKIL